MDRQLDRLSNHFIFWGRVKLFDELITALKKTTQIPDFSFVYMFVYIYIDIFCLCFLSEYLMS